MSRQALLRSLAAVLLVSVAVLLALPSSAARDKKRTMDLITTAPDFASYGVKSIAMLPVATYDASVPTARLVAGVWSQKLKDTGYRWVSAAMSRDLLLSALGDSTLRLVNAEILRQVRVDSLRAPLLCTRLHTDAVLCVRVEQWEQQPVLWNQSGKPMTTVQLKAALVDSSGTLLWSASGSETGEGPYHDPSTNPIGVSSSSLENMPVTGQGGPPAYEDVLTRLLLRWAPQFPPPTAASPAAH